MGDLLDFKKVPAKLLRKALKELNAKPKEPTRFDRLIEAKPIGIQEARRILRDPGYRENEYGELVSTIRKLSMDEVMDRLQAKVHFEICQMEDERLFRSLADLSLDLEALAQIPGQR